MLKIPGTYKLVPPSDLPFQYKNLDKDLALKNHAGTLYFIDER